MSQPPLRRAHRARFHWTPLVATGVALLGLLGAALIPPAPLVAPEVDSGAARLTRMCPTTDAGAQAGLGATAGDVTQAPLGEPGKATAAASGTVLALAKEPVRLSAPMRMSFWGIVSASAPTGLDAGLSLAPCRAPRAEAWLTGVRSNADARSELVLMNLDAVDASVNVAVSGTEGLLAAPGARGIVVGPQSQRSLPLGPIVDSAGPLTLQVTTSSGRVAVYVRERLFAGTASAGSDWIAPGADPATTVVLPSVPAGDGTRTLVVGNPGDRTAQVKVEILGPDGAFSPVGVEQVDVPGHTTKTFALEKALTGKAASLRLTATFPVVAALEARTATDVGVANGAAPLGSLADAVVPLPTGVSATLTLANPTDRPVAVTASAKDASGKEVASKSVELPASGSVVLDPVPGVSTWHLTAAAGGVRVGVAASGPVGSVAGLSILSIEDAAAPVPSIALTPDPRLRG